MNQPLPSHRRGRGFAHLRSPGTTPIRALASALLLTLPTLAKHASATSPFATRILTYEPGPGQFASDPQFNDPARALGPPIGGSLAAPDNTKCVTLGGISPAGVPGRLILGFDHPIINQAPSPENPHGLDVIVYGNAFYVGGNPNRRWAEPAIILISADTNANGLPDDPWYLIPGSHLDLTGTWPRSSFLLPPAVFAGPVVLNPNGLASQTEGFFGYADCTPTMLLGDLDSDGLVDDPALTPEQFYTRPDDPFTVGITPGSGGGDAIDISWAIDLQTGLPATLPQIDFIQLRTGVSRVSTPFGESSPEISGVAEVIISSPPPPLPLADVNADGIIDGSDFVAFINSFALGEITIDPLADVNGDGVIDGSDFVAFINSFARGN